MTKGRRVAALLLLAAALGLAALGQYYFFHRREYLWDGVVFHGLAVLCFVLVWRLGYPRKVRAARHPSFSLDTWLRQQAIPLGLIAFGMFLSFIATMLARDRTLSQSTVDVVVLWLLGIGAVGTAVLWPVSWRPSHPSDWKSRLQQVQHRTWLEVVIVASLTIVALILRITALDIVPYTLGGDEAWHGLLARQVLTGQVQNPFNMGYMSMPNFFYWPLSWSLWLVGDNIVGLRFPAALAGTVTVPVLYLFARGLWGRRIAFVSAAFLATYDYHIHYSRLGANNVWDPLFVVLVLWVLDRGLTTSDKVKRARFFTLAGLVMGLSFYFYTGARLLPLVVIVYFAYVWVQRGLKRTSITLNRDWGWHLALLILAFLVAAGPMLGFALAHPDQWNARLNQVGILQSGWLAREPGLTGKSTPQILAEQFLRSAGAFHVFSDRTVWYGAMRPLLGPLAGAFAMLGMAWAIIRWRDRRYFLVFLWFWSVIITAGMLTESPPSSQRLVIAIPAVALLVTFGLDRSVRLTCRLLDFDRNWEPLMVGLLIVILAVGNVRFYFVEFTPLRRYGSENGETATMIGHYLRDLEGDYQAYFFGAPRIYWNFGTMAFLEPEVPGYDVTEPLDSPPDFVDERRNAVFVFLPERIGELAWVQQAFPDGHFREFHDAEGRVRFTVYEVRQ